MMLVYVVTASASAICAAPRIARSPFLTPPFFAAANDGRSASNADAPARTPAPVTAVRLRNSRRSDPRPSVVADMSRSPFRELLVGVETRVTGVLAPAERPGTPEALSSPQSV